MNGEPPDPIRRWLLGTPLRDLPKGTEDRVREVATRHGYIVKGTIEGLEAMHRIAIQRYGEISDSHPPDDRMRQLQHGASHVYMAVAESVVALRDWARGRMG